MCRLFRAPRRPLPCSARHPADLGSCPARYYKTLSRLRALYAKRANKLKQSHELLANEILDQVGCDITVEQMSMAGLAKRSKKNKINKKTGRPRSKKRFGKSIQNHAPSMFVAILARKAAARGGQVVKENPTPIKQRVPLPGNPTGIGLPMAASHGGLWLRCHRKG